MAVAVLDANSVITAVNDEYVAQVMSRQASVGTSFADIFVEADRRTVNDALARSAGGGMERVDGVRILPCGPGPHDVPRSAAAYNWTLLQHNDGFLGAAAAAAGASGAWSSEAEELKDLFNRAPIAMHWLSSDGKVLWANDRELEVLGYSREEYIGADILDFCPDSKDDFLEIFEQLRSGNAIHDFPIRFRTKAGKIRNLLIDSSVAYNTDGSFNHTRCFARDDTGRIVAEARAKAAAAAAKKLAEGKERFSSMLLHNIRTPLHIMTMNLSDPTSIDVPNLVSQMGKLSGLCASVAQATKFGDGYFLKPLPAPTSLSSLVRECRKMEGVSHEVVIEELGFDESLVVLADGKMIRTVLRELIAHADGRSPDGAQIRLLVKRNKEETPGEGEGNHFEFSVVDSGEELDEAQVEKVFRNYWLVNTDVAERNERDGSAAVASWDEETERMQRLASLEERPGRRLNVAFNYVHCLESVLRVASDTSTTKFTFTLPLLQTSSLLQDPRTDDAHHRWKATPPSASTPAGPSSTTLPRLKPGASPKHQRGMGVSNAVRQHVLIVEDNTICQKMCKRIVTSLGYKADTADNGAIAVEMVTRRDGVMYDMVLMDIRMPVMDGITAALKIHDVFPELPIVAFSAEESETTQAEALGVMVAFMTKPANSNKMKEIIQHHARRPSVRQSGLSGGNAFFAQRVG